MSFDAAGNDCAIQRCLMKVFQELLSRLAEVASFHILLRLVIPVQPCWLETEKTHHIERFFRKEEDTGNEGWQRCHWPGLGVMEIAVFIPRIKAGIILSVVAFF